VCTVAVFGAQGAVAGDTRCTGTITGTHDNVVVPPGAGCAINDADVKGNVKALENSRLFADGTTFGGNVVGDKAELVHLNNSTIRGNLEVKEGETDDPGFDVFVTTNTFTGGNLKIEKMTGVIVVTRNTGVGNMQVVENSLGFFDSLIVEENEVAGDLQVLFKNSGGFKEVIFNTVGGNLQCSDNDPLFVGQPNTVTGNAEGQCAQP
jgi:hypothetical protein